MASVRPIRTEADYEAALARIEALMNARAGSPDGEELDVLTDLVEHYEEKSDPLGFPDPVTAIEFRMDQEGLTERDLVPWIGSPALVADVLARKRALTISMARALYKHLGIPADILLRSPVVA